MRLISIDVERHGIQQRIQLGPISAGLNAIYGPQGAGKTTLLHWLRMVAEENQNRSHSYPAPVWSASDPNMAGAAEIENRGYQYRVVTDRNGRIRFDHLRTDSSYAGHTQTRWDGRVDDQIGNSNLTPVQREAFVGLAAAVGNYDTEAALEQLAQRLGIDTQDNTNTHDRDALAAREHELVVQLERLGRLRGNREVLRQRQQNLEAELHALHATGQTLRYEGQGVEVRRIDERYGVLDRDLQATLAEVERLDREIASKESELKMLELDPTAAVVGDSYRKQLQDLDDRLTRWRQTLRDLRSHRETIEYNATDARLDKQIGDQLATSKEPDPRAPMRSLEAQIISTRQQLDLLVDQYTSVPGYDYRSASAAVAGTGFRPNEVPSSHGVYRDLSGRTYVGHPTYLPDASALPETLRSMQKDLHEVCQQLSRREANAATETLKAQAAQLKRCEQELLHSVEKLIDERSALLRRIANEHHVSLEQLTLAFGEWCQCHDHPSFHDWLLSEESNSATRPAGIDSTTREQMLDSIEALKKARTAASVRADECRRQIRDADIHRRGVVARKAEPGGRTEAEIQYDLQQVASDLAAIADADRLTAELEEVRSQLRNATPVVQHSAFRDSVHRHIAELMSQYRAPVVSPTNRLADYHSDTTGRRYDLVDGVVSESSASTSNHTTTRQAVPAEIIRLAMRLAIVETLTQRGESIPLVLDESLDNMPSALQASAIGYLSIIANKHQQILLLTSETNVTEYVRAQGGWIGNMTAVMQPAPAADDPNRLLAAAANDHEADKWRQPVVTHTRTSSSQYYLSENSLVEDLPAIDPDLAVRCRGCGVDRIGDLLDVDPVWLASEIRVRGVSDATIGTWQSIAILLCNVPNLRPFDARIIVGAGIRDAQQLANMHPSQLLDRVEYFLNTDRGRQILRSGSSYELSRITAWITAAKGGSDRLGRFNGFGEGDPERYNPYSNGSRGRSVRSSNRRGYTNRRRVLDGYDRNYDADDREYDSYGYEERDSENGRRDGYRRYERNGNSHSSSRTSRSSGRGRSERSSQRSYSSRNGSVERSGTERQKARSESVETEVDSSSEETKWKFYLELASPVVDAPSIGPRMASRLEEHGVETVSDLLEADAATLAEQLDNRRVDEETVLAWQNQARLVCRIPNLRGHDAQLLVACEITSPESVALMDAEALLADVGKVAGSKEGQRILRGSKEPDLEEVNDWIAWASNSREIATA
ncbi:MAG: DUF4332 domain-containing protein [Aureliella sp.]